jgi:hypothetical protein
MPHGRREDESWHLGRLESRFRQFSFVALGFRRVNRTRRFNIGFGRFVYIT